mgnify:CR=1 FL=1
MTSSQPSPDRPPLKTIEKSGTYTLRLCKPKPEKITTNSAGFPTCKLFFVDAEGNCFNKIYSTQWGSKQIAILVGKFSNQFIKPSEQMTLQEFGDLINMAANCVAKVELEVKENGEWPPGSGRKQFKYQLKNIESIIGNKNGQPTLQAEAPNFDKPIPDYSKPSDSNPF